MRFTRDFQQTANGMNNKLYDKVTNDKLLSITIVSYS